MSCTSSLDVILWKAESIGDVIPVLHAAGWKFWPGQIQYRCYVEVGDDEISAVAPSESWQELVPLWDEQCRNSRIVWIDYQWQDEDDKTMYILFSREPENLQLLRVQCLLFPSWAKLCGRVTDWSWYLSRIVCPMQQSDLGVLHVVCDDDNV
jgi:hypothetical protein